jgi:hypothetical protein
MYIHRYQIHNVLNVYRKQLSTGPAAAMNRGIQAVSVHVEISRSHRRYLMDRLSAEIVERISRAEGEKSEAVEELSSFQNKAQDKKSDFTYTAIDENNRKISNTLPIEKLSQLTGRQVEEERKGVI